MIDAVKVCHELQVTQAKLGASIEDRVDFFIAKPFEIRMESAVYVGNEFVKVGDHGGRAGPAQFNLDEHRKRRFFLV